MISTMIDLSSDTATKPSEGMRRVMAAAPVGDEQKREDPTTNELQERAAELLGKEAAMFLPSATMSNLIALKTHLRPGDEFIATHNSHIVVWEGGGYAAVAGAAVYPLTTERGVFTGAQVKAAIRPDDPHYTRTRLVCVENTHNAGGGTVWTPEELEDVASAARENGLALHLDGARLANACASGFDRRRIRWLGVDVLVLGGTKAGMPPTEAIVLFDRALGRRFDARLKQGGQLPSKGRYYAAPWIGMLESGAWLRHAAHANAMARRLSEAQPFPLAHPVEANAIFVRMDEPRLRALQAQGWRVYRFTDGSVRFMCSWATTTEAVDAFAHALRALA